MNTRTTVSIKIGDQNPPVRFDSEIPLNPGDQVIVESPNGAEWGTVAGTSCCKKNSGGQNNMVLRLATATDQTQIAKLKKEAETALSVAANRIEKYKLDMKLISAYYTLDGGKVFIQFSAEQRVDFRELVRDLAYSLRARIELKQIGPRDEAKLTGALGTCGNICCCNRFGEDGRNITIKMAKTQNLSLNPQKINGMCGRLLCCLSYENAHYAEVGERMPRWGQEVITPDGKGIAQDSHMLKETVNVKFQNKDTTKTGCYKLCDIKCPGGCRKNRD